jgi:6-phosphogluconate dehydrogenase
MADDRMELGHCRPGKDVAFMEDTGEVNWLIDDAMHMEVPVHIKAQAVMQLFASRDEKNYWVRSVAMMRRGFGGHTYGPDDAVCKERRTGRIGGFITEDE